MTLSLIVFFILVLFWINSLQNLKHFDYALHQIYEEYYIGVICYILVGTCFHKPLFFNKNKLFQLHYMFEPESNSWTRYKNILSNVSAISFI